MSPLHQAWPDYVVDPSDSKLAFRFDDQDQFNILYKKVEQFSLTFGGPQRNIELANFTDQEWMFLIIRCIGDGGVVVTGFDTDGTTPITSEWGVYGNRLLPGIVILSTYNATSFAVESLVGESTFEVFAAVSCADNDPRMDSNA